MATAFQTNLSEFLSQFIYLDICSQLLQLQTLKSIRVDLHPHGSRSPCINGCQVAKVISCNPSAGSLPPASLVFANHIIVL